MESPAIVTNKHGESDRVDLVVFSNTGNSHVMRVPFSIDMEEENTWHWPTEPQAKPVQLPAQQETVPPVDKGPDTAQDTV